MYESDNVTACLNM